jgi:nucleolar pre-ribosomal-associated protein 2
MTSGTPEEREKAYLEGATSLLQTPCQDSDRALRIVLLHAFITTVQDSSAARKLTADGLDLASLQTRLLQLTSQAVTSAKRNGKGLLTLLVALEALGDLDREAVRQALSDAVPSLVALGDALLDSGAQAGWEVRMFLVNHFPEALASPWKIKMCVAVPTAAEADAEAEGGEAGAGLDKTALLRYVDAVVRAADQDTKLGHIQELLEDGSAQDELGRLLVIYRLIQHLKGG